jgi:hypothetical protein
MNKDNSLMSGVCKFAQKHPHSIIRIGAVTGAVAGGFFATTKVLMFLTVAASVVICVTSGAVIGRMVGEAICLPDK